MFFTAVVLLIITLVAIGGLGLLIYVIVNRIRQKENENFPDRDN